MDEIKEFALDQGIESGRRLVEDQNGRIVLKGLNQADLLPVALGQLAEGPGRIEMQSLDQLANARTVVVLSQLTEPGEQLFSGHRWVDPEVAGQIADAASDFGIASRRSTKNGGLSVIREGKLVTVSPVRELLDRARHRLELRFSAPITAELFKGVPGVVEAEVRGDTATIAVDGAAGPAMEAALRGPGLLRVRSAGDDLEDLFISLYDHAPEVQ